MTNKLGEEGNHQTKSTREAMHSPSYWGQRAKQLWLKHGDRCSKMFHKVMNNNPENNSVRRLNIQGAISEDPVLIKTHVSNFYLELYRENRSERPFFDNLPLKTLAPDSRVQLERNFTEDEILTALHSLAGDKSPGPDGFPMEVYQRSWHFMKKEIMAVVEEFQNNGRLDCSLNATFVSLIAKKEGGKGIEDYRLICLQSGIYKIIGKTLALRLKEVLGELISDFQCGGVAGRQIHEGILIVNELVNSRFKSKKPGLIFKLDFRKAFDMVSWKFLRALLSKFGFGETWCKWLQTCWSSARFSILINGTPEGFFSSPRGLRQGDPMSPMIFSLVAESLTQLFLVAQSERLLQGFVVKEEGVMVPLMQYADDTIVLCDDNIDMADTIRGLLLWFEASTGLQLNSAKTKIFEVNKTSYWDQVVKRWGCAAGYLPDVYLGLSLACGYKDRSASQGLVEEFRKRLATWKKRYLTRPGRLVLLKSTLTTLPVFMFSLVVVPASVLDELEKIMKNFLWGSTDEKRKFHLLSWAQVCVPMEWGGLGVKRLRDVNVSLLCKWLWELGEQEDRLWKKIIFEKYGQENGGWYTKDCTKPHGCGFWKGLMKSKEFFTDNVHFMVGNGKRVRFWEDKWCLNGKLETKFPLLYKIARNKNRVISEVIKIGSAGAACDIEPCRRLTDEEIEEAANLSSLLSNFWFSSDDDLRQWEDGAKSFGAKTVAQTLSERRSLTENLGVYDFPDRRVWKTKLVPSRVAFYTWTLIRGRVLTTYNLIKRGLHLINRCSMCKGQGESIEHLFVSCPFTKLIWDYFWVHSEVGRGAVFSLKQRSMHGAGEYSSRLGRLYWSVTFHAIAWSIWCERNRRCLEGKERSLLQIICDVKEAIWESSLGTSEGKSELQDVAICNWDTIMLR